MRLFLRRRLLAVLCMAFFHITAAFVGTSSHFCCTTNHCHAASSSDASNNDSDVVLGFGLDAALRRLDLPPAQEAVVRERLDKVRGGKTNLHNINNNIEGNLSWLETRLDLRVEQLGALVVGFPPVLGLELETNLKPTVSFFSHALSGGGNRNDNDNGDENESNNKDLARIARLAKFLCESPSLLEYNVAKRLAPRLAQVRAALDVASVDEEGLKAIATKTDSKFEAWLNNEKMMIGGNGGDGYNVENADHDDNHCDPNDVHIENNSRRQDGPSAYVVVSNLQSGGNIGNIVRSASIFGCEECLVVGQKRYRLAGDHGARFDLPRRHMWSHSDVRSYLHEKRVRIYGIEIMADAEPIMRYDRDTGVMRFPFDRQWQGAAFIFGNEGQGLSAKQREICDEFLFIPQTRGGTTTAGGGSASLNVASAATVILQAYCMWAGYSDAPREGEKFLATASGDKQINTPPPQLFET